jgi:transcriptional regulator with XRE-family HTH domain
MSKKPDKKRKRLEVEPPKRRRLSPQERTKREKRLNEARAEAPAADFAFRVLVLYRLWRARREAGLTQAKLAESIEREQKLVSEIETGQSDLTLKTALALARELGTDVPTLFAVPDFDAENVADAVEKALVDGAMEMFAEAAAAGQRPPEVWDVIETLFTVSRGYRRRGAGDRAD